MKVNDIIKVIEDFAPLGLAYSWDNSGLLCGDINKEVKKIYITLDVDKYTVDEAVNAGCDMIVSHHPIMLGGIKQINYDTPDGYILKTLIENNIALYSSHIPTDKTKGGINDVLAEKLEIFNKEVIEQDENYKGCGLGRIGDLEPVKLEDFARRVKEKLNTPFVRVCGDFDKIIKRAAVGSGGCSDLIPTAKKLGADVMVTADVKYHISRDSVEEGICVIDAGHYPTEVFVIDIFEKCLEKLDVELVKATDCDIFKII